MKKLFLGAVMAIGILGASAQTQKIGYINTEELMSIMPESEIANKELQEFQNSLAKQQEDLAKEADDKATQFVKDSAKLSPSMKEIKREEIIKLYQRVQNYNGEAQERAKQAAQQKFLPIQQKALEAIKTVAKKSGYTYVLDFNTVIVGPPGDDILALVKKELNIKDPAPAKPAVPKAN